MFAIAIAANLQLLAAVPTIPGGLFHWEPMLEFDTTHNSFRNDLLTEPLNIQAQVKANGGSVTIPSGPGLGVTPDRKFMGKYNICNYPVRKNYENLFKKMILLLLCLVAPPRSHLLTNNINILVNFYIFNGLRHQCRNYLRFN